jgi:hypothetical protein
MRLTLGLGVAAAVLVVSGCAGSAPQAAKKDATRITRVALRTRGVLVEGSGGVCIGPQGAFFSPSLPGLVSSPPPTVCDGQIRLRGFDFSGLKLQPVGHGVELGAANVKGVYRSGVLTVMAQGRPRLLQPKPLLNALPCRQPAGGWPSTPVSSSSLWQAVHAYRPQSDLTARYFFRSHGTTVAAVASTHPARTRRALEPLLPGRLCIVRSQYGNRTIDKVRTRLAAGPPGIREGFELSPAVFGPGRAQPVIQLSIAWFVTPQLRAFLRTMPRGLIQLFPSLRRVGQRTSAKTH